MFWTLVGDAYYDSMYGDVALGGRICLIKGLEAISHNFRPNSLPLLLSVLKILNSEVVKTGITTYKTTIQYGIRNSHTGHKLQGSSIHVLPQ